MKNKTELSKSIWLAFPLLVALAPGCGTDSAPASTVPVPAATSTMMNQPAGSLCDAQCALAMFRALAVIYRPSGEEKEIRDQIVALAQKANDERWGGKLEILAPDAIGNFVIRVPATGTFANQKLPAVALQSHMDMVLAATDVPAGGDLKAYFRGNPVRLETVGDVIQSVGKKTTIGADDTVGCAIELRYALDPTIPHPPLELVFTVFEEIGLKGASEYDTTKLPLRAPVMISLDGDNSDKLIYGSQGSARRSVSGAIAAATVVPNKLVKVSVSKLLGGHSGLDIHRERLNAVLTLGSLADVALTDPSIMGVISAVSGDLGGINKIPTSLELNLAVGTSFNLAAMQGSMRSTVNGLVASHMGEASNTGIIVDVVEMARSSDPVTVLSAEDARRLVRTVLAMDVAASPLNGVLSKSDEFPNKVNTSSNLGFLEIKLDPGARDSRQTTLAFMTRSFTNAELETRTAQIAQHLKTAFPDPSAAKVTTISGYQPWVQDKDSWLIRLAAGPAAARRFSQVSVQPVGLEPSYFLTKYPKLHIVGMSPTIVDYHTPRENVSVGSVVDIVGKIDGFLIELAAAPEFKNTPQ
jgi:dipeptidase D